MSLVTIIMPYFKKEFFLENSIKSILNQTYKNFEIILINDEINSKSVEFLENISNKDNRIKVLTNKKNLGAGESRNMGINYSKGEYIAFCDCDDLWVSEKLDKQIKFMKKNNINFCHTSYDIINENEDITASRKAKSKINFKELRKSCDIGLSTVIIKKKIFDNTQFKFASLKTKEDFVLWLKMAKAGIEIIGLDEKLSIWRKISNSLSSSTIQKLFDGYKVYRNYLKYGKIKSLIFLIVLSVSFILKK